MSQSQPAVSESNRIIARTIATIFETEKPEIRFYWDDNHSSHLSIVKCKDSPQPGLTSYATIGVSDHPLYKGEGVLPFRLELVGACESNNEQFPNMLATAGFCLINSRWSCAPGTIYPDIASMYDASSTMKHCMFVPPFLWEDTLTTLELPDKKVTWLMMIPISEAEYRFAETKGSDALEAALELKRIDVFDIERPSIV